jgi:Uncharacterized conserved protein (DUF2039)
MPQQGSTSGTANNNTRKGKVPAHQNKYAFKHNPKSKLTEIILKSPIEYCCYRCTEKLVWRKKYRKYKPLSQPSICNICHCRNITAAYHTVCNNCSIYSDKAQNLLQLWNNNINNNVSDSPHNTTQATSSKDEELLVNINNEVHSDDDDGNSDYDVAADESKNDINNSIISSTTDNEQPIIKAVIKQHRRVCTICFKEPALPSPGDDNTDDENDINNGKLKLRQIKTIQRNKTREINEKKKLKKELRQQQQQQQNNNTDHNDDTIVQKLHINNNSSDDDDDTEDENDDDDVNDPFLQAVGGKDKLLTGDAYQQMLLRKK